MSRSKCPSPLVSIACVTIALACTTRHGHAAPPPDSASRSQATTRHQVTLIGVTRGMSFLAADDPVSDGGRELGSHQVEWIQIKLLVENHDPGDPLIWYQWRLLTPNGTEFVLPKNAGRTIAHASSTIECELADPRLPGLLYPVSLPKSAAGKQARVLIVGVSGTFSKSKTAELVFLIGETKDNAERLVFKLPMP